MKVWKVKDFIVRDEVRSLPSMKHEARRLHDAKREGCSTKRTYYEVRGFIVSNEEAGGLRCEGARRRDTTRSV